MFTQEKLDLKSEIIDYPILKKFEGYQELKLIGINSLIGENSEPT